LAFFGFASINIFYSVKKMMKRYLVIAFLQIFVRLALNF